MMMMMMMMMIMMMMMHICVASIKSQNDEYFLHIFFDVQYV